MSAAASFRLAFEPLFEQTLKQLDEAARPLLRRCAVKPLLGKRSAQEAVELSKKLKVAPTLNGDKYLAKTREILASRLGLKRSNTQVRFHESFLQAVARILYRSDGEQADLSAIMEREGWADLQQQVCCLTPRRFGKTTAVAMFAAALGMTVPNIEIAIFSTGRRASSKLLEQISELVLNNNPEIADGLHDLSVAKNNCESFWLRHATATGHTLAKINSYPSAAKTLRG